MPNTRFLTQDTADTLYAVIGGGGGGSLPAGGATGNVLEKASAADGDVHWAGLTTADIPDSTNKRYVTDAQQTVLGNTSGVNTGDQDLSGKVDKNTAITGATKTKITYDSKGLVTAGADATTADVADSTDKRYVTDAQRTVIQNTSGTNTGDQTLSDATISTSNITTNNVTSTKHGFAPKSPSDATWFLNGAATPAYAAVKDGDLSTSDVTTNDVGTAKHGFAPKAPNDTNQVIRGDGAWAVQELGFTNLAPTVGHTIPANYSAVAVGKYAIASGTVLILAAGSVLAII